MRGKAPVLGTLAFASLLACQTDDIAPTIRSFERSGEVSFVCAENVPVFSDSGDVQLGVVPSPVPLSDCDADGFSVLGDRRLYALVTQTVRGELAVVELTQDGGNLSNGSGVVDTDPQIPGESFLPLGAQPTGITSTPGSAFTFVGSAAVGLEGIFVIPTTKLRAPLAGDLGGTPPTPPEPPRDITGWSACSLSSPPGEMVVLLDPPDDDGKIRSSCAEPPTGPPDPPFEGGAPGRRKLAVTLPEEGRVVLIDAEDLSSPAMHPPGSYRPCIIERSVQLVADLPGTPIPQVLPADLAGGVCEQEPLEYPPLPGPYAAQPRSMALAQGTASVDLYIGDRTAPVIHKLDVTDPCEMRQLPPLLPRSFREPNRVVTSSAIAVSPEFPRYPAGAPESGAEAEGTERYLYAVDDKRGSVMAFDVSDPSSSRTPIVRANSVWLPFAVPDRIEFTSPVKALSFAYNSLPDPEGEAALTGVLCNPAENADARQAGYREGAGPTTLRGVFGFAALADGKLAVIDVGDFDAPCRRPQAVNHTNHVTFQGCVPMDGGVTFAAGATTDESSCHVVAQHRARSRLFVRNSSASGPHTPELAEDNFSLPNLGSDYDSEASPRLLAVNYNVGSQSAPIEEPAVMWKRGAPDDGRVDDVLTDPNAERAIDDVTFAMILQEPRAYPSSNRWTATYEGVFASGVVAFIEDADSADEEATIFDATVSFCGFGTQDERMAREAGEGLKAGPESVAFDTEVFAQLHADILQVTQPLADPKDYAYPAPYTHKVCLEAFGDFGEGKNPTPKREFVIRNAYTDQLTVTPRDAGTNHPGDIFEGIRQCFAGGFSYSIRGQKQWIVQSGAFGFQHHVTSERDADDPALQRCVQDCNPERQELNGRVYPVSCATSAILDQGETEAEPLFESECNQVGYTGAGPESGVACAFPKELLDRKGIPFNHPCAYQNEQQRFAIYWGKAEPVRDSVFDYSVENGFAPLSVNLASGSSLILPETLQFNPILNQLVVTDGQSGGLTFITVNPLGRVTVYN